MDWITRSQNFMALVSIPIAIMTVINARKNWKSLWDDDLTNYDRALLTRMALFTVMPIIVFFHECGHAVATILCGGQVQEFYYGFLWGYVVPKGDFTDLQLLWIYLAGNLVEIGLGLLALTIAVFSRAPAVVALGVYVAFWAVGGTLIFYTLLSVIGAYGDWQAIYSSPLRNDVHIIAVAHAFAVGLIFWCAFSETTTLWFARKTIPTMVEPEQQLLKELEDAPSRENLLKLVWFYYKIGVYKIARRYTKQIDKISANWPDNQLALGWIEFASDNLVESKKTFTLCAENPTSTPMLQCRALLGAGACMVAETETNLRGAPGTVEDWSQAVAVYSKAHEVVPDLGDPLFYRALLFEKQHLYNRAESDLHDMLQMQCLDANLFERAEAKLAGIQQIAAKKQ